MSVNDQSIWAKHGTVQPTEAKLLEVCESTQASYYSGLGYTYPSTQKMAKADCLKRFKP